MIYIIPFVLFLVVYYPPRCLLRYLSECFYNRVLFFVDTKHPCVALTIDDSPSPNTPAILSILKKYGVKCTFFVIGTYAEKYPETAFQMFLDGHELANHGLCDRRAIELDRYSLEHDILDTQKIISSITKKRDTSQNYRPGCGFFNTRMIKIAQLFCYQIVLASVYPYDCICRIPIINYLYILFKLRCGDIIVVHDRPWTIPMLEMLLPKLQSRGLEIVTVEKLQSLNPL